ncbi:hypothetical protein ABZS79_35175 [Streptomyces griseoloalbus]|uniref:hypothetical protein n=1 Tax=Streptomyces griseoloalbus TaxID=67303 RepID=UPI0033AED5EC
MLPTATPIVITIATARVSHAVAATPRHGAAAATTPAKALPVRQTLPAVRTHTDTGRDGRRDRDPHHAGGVS